ncbi:hypothetical protein RHSIM_Rhsim07G0122600 [Rhododendron simsii]|uniref:Uncharacterized protein n=1 Tax=Rhododendron simsii TaxID=118357 RepID=A0A834GWQ8_RHOSS|nr:hypothetical protein RHSIM_Rhsim07G0122600 [Rhododendron simsii]
MWLRSNTTAHGFNQDLHDYELMHHELSKLHDTVLALQDYTFKLPATASKQLRKRHNRLSKKFPTREAKFKRKAHLQFGPLLAKKIRLEAEANTRKQEQDFLTFTWERFHALVAWTTTSPSSFGPTRDSLANKILLDPVRPSRGSVSQNLAFFEDGDENGIDETAWMLSRLCNLFSDETSKGKRGFASAFDQRDHRDAGRHDSCRGRRESFCI